MRLTLQLLISHGRVARKMGRGPESRINMLRNLVTALVRHERIETTWARADETQFYADKLIDYAKKGDTDEKAMKMASFWLTEKDLVPKLFKVLAPRFKNHSHSYTQMMQVPKKGNLNRAKLGVLEYKGNPFPPLYPAKKRNRLTLINQLLQGYKEEMGLRISKPQRIKNWQTSKNQELANLKEKDQELANLKEKDQELANPN